MDLDPSTLDLRDRAASAEPPTTRPNPFDDTDISSRKRRRTSTSGSPAKSVDIVNPLPDSPSSGTLDGDVPVSDNTELTKLDTEPITPQTPEHLCSSEAPPVDAPSSMVTINLRNVALGENMSSPISPSGEPKESKASASRDDVKSSVEDLEVDMVQLPEDTPQSSSSHSESPPIELITVPSDDDIAFEGEGGNVSIIEQDQPLVDPLQNFPYQETGEALLGTVQRLTAYLSDQGNIDESVLDRLHQWLESYLRYINIVDRQTARTSFSLHRDFWLAFPEVTLALLNRRPPLTKVPAFHRMIMDFYAAFSRLTAWFITLDLHTVRDLALTPLQPGRRGPDLFTYVYLHQFHVLILQFYNSQLADNDGLLPQSDGALYLMNEFQEAPGGRLLDLANLAKGIIDLIPTFPRLADSLASICQVAGDIMAGAARCLSSPQQQNQPSLTLASRKQLELGQKVHTLVLDTLLMMIEKHVTQLNSDSLSCCIHALSEMLRWSLQGTHQSALDRLRDHREANPEVLHKQTIDAIAWEQRFDMLVKLIQSSQMQLRVMAVSAMCADLVACWKRYSENSGEDGITYLNHLASHLLRSQLVQYILGPNCHPEITGESANIIGFLVVTKTYRQEHTDLLWQCITSSQDPRVVDALTRMTSGIINLFDYPILLAFCEKLQTLPVEGFTPSIRSLWDQAIRQILHRASMDGTKLDFHPYHLCLRLLREASVRGPDSHVAYPEMQRAALQKFVDLVNHSLDDDVRQRLYLTCVEDITQKSPTTLGSLWGLIMTMRPGIVSEMHILTEKHNLTKLIVDELEHVVDSGQGMLNLVVLAEGMNQPRRDFISHMILLEPLKIDAELGQKLWDLLVGPRSLCLADREAGWDILNGVFGTQSFLNPYLQTCLLQHLPALPAFCFCGGMLRFIREAVLPRLNNSCDLILDDEEAVATSGIEQLWRLILEADEGPLVERAIRTLVVDIYIDSRHILTNPLHRNRQIHLAVVNRCLRQLKEAAKIIQASTDGTSSGDEEPMVIVTTEDQMQEQERIFTRSLQLLRFFLEAHQSRPQFAAPDLRTLISDVPYEIEGDSAELKYQSFDGDQQTDVKPLSIGKLNTAASLLASIRDETGFTNYRMYYRGRPFLPNEREICKSLDDLHVHDGLILVKREEDGPPPSARIKPGASPLEVEISAHFDEMWEYLSMEERLAKEIYYFLIKLPTDGHALGSVHNDDAFYKSVFSPGQPYKSLYAINAIAEAAGASHNDKREMSQISKGDPALPSPDLRSVRESMALIVRAISDEDLLDRASASLRLKLSHTLVNAVLRCLSRLDQPHGSFNACDVQLPAPDRLISFIYNALDSQGEVALSAVAVTLNCIMRLSLLATTFWEKLIEDPTFSPMLHRLLLLETRKGIRANAAKQIEELAIAEWAMLSVSEPISATTEISRTQYFWSIIVDLVSLTTNAPSQCEEVFKVAHSLMSRMATKSFFSFNLPDLASKASGLLLNHTSVEEVGQMNGHDLVARGLTLLLHRCLQLDKSLTTSSTFADNLAETLLQRHLYPHRRTQTEQPVPRVILDADTRAMLCDIVIKLVKHDRQKVAVIMRELNCLIPFFHQEDDEPYLYELPYHFERGKALRSPCGYVGLQNLSNTCYLNSLLTQLFMNSQFRSFIVNARVQDPSNSQQLLFYTQKLFGYMQETYRRFVDPTNFVSAIKAYDDTPIDVHNQMDVDEFYSLLFDRWEAQLMLNSERKKLRSFYGGQLVQQVKSKECDHISERLEPFSAIQCDIKGMSSLEESLQAYVDGEVMEGDNKYKCSTCDRHVDAVKRACLKDIPDNVIFHLKRFDFNLRTLQRSKINDYFSFPTRVNLRPYTVEHLTQPSNDGEEDIFELVGILVHAGTAESGHYYSFIRERPTADNRPTWIEFNDDMVTPWDFATLENLTFGGAEQRPTYENNGILYEKQYSAYMLFYQRASSLESEAARTAQSDAVVPLRVDIPEELREHILDENTVILRRHCLFDPTFTNLVRHLFTQARVFSMEGSEVPAHLRQSISRDPRTGSNDNGLQATAMHLALSTLDQVVSRAKDHQDFITISNMIQEAMHSNVGWAFEFYLYFSKRYEALRALLQRNPVVLVRSTISNMFALALSRISKDRRNQYLPFGSRRSSAATNDGADDLSRESGSIMGHSVLEGTVFILLYLWRFFPVHIKAWDEYFDLVLKFAQLGPREVAHLLGEDFLSKLLHIIAADATMDLTPSYTRMLNNINRRGNTRATSYVAIIALIRHLLGQLSPKLSAETIVDDPTERTHDESGPFNWTADEVSIVHSSLDGQPGSGFVDKLLGIDQAHSQTDDILRFLAGTSLHMDNKILHTLKFCIQGETSSHAMDPYLRGAAVYIESTVQADNATKMVNHIHNQVATLQGTEAISFLNFFKTALHLRRADLEFVAAVHKFSIELVPKWAPFLLVYPERTIRAQAEDFVGYELFRALYAEASESEGHEARANDTDGELDMKAIVQQLGMQILFFLQENYVRRRAQFGQDASGTILRVLERCARQFETDPANRGDLDVEFGALQTETLAAVQRLIVNDVEEDGSDWEGSCGSSDQAGEVLDIGVQGVNDVNDMDLV